ncbi:MAG: thioredoxin-disulfide reductase [Synergistaceae bacterium]|jgi:thioredoxin reductase (NADPH)|nr:thioredoxin-disulfide reductase [Synergistaceae bacterium]
MEHRQLVIIGAGPAGLTAAIYGRRAGLDTLVLENGIYGGMINSTAEIENYPGFEKIDGMGLASAMRAHAAAFAPEFRDCRVESVALGGTRDKIVLTDKGELSADALIIATGTSFAHAGCKGEEKFTGKGVSYCAVCDGAFYADAPAAVIGGGNAAVEEAVYLTQFASRVYIVHRRKEFRADSALVERALANPKIEPVLGYVTDEIFGDEMLEGVRLTNLETGEKRTLSVEGVFVFVGMKPVADFLMDGAIERAWGGWIKTNDQMETSVEGVFAAGDIREKFLRQVVTAVGDGATAAMSAYEYISNLKYLEGALFERPHVYAFLSSSIDPAHISLAHQVEEWKKSSGMPLVSIDAYRNRRVSVKLGVRETPSLVELRNGAPVRTRVISCIGDVKSFIQEVV